MRLQKRAAALGVGAIIALTALTGGVASAAPVSGNVPARCANAPAALAKIQKIETQIAAGLPKLTKAEQTARAKGNTVRADRLEKRIQRLESAKFSARLSKMSQRIQNRCHLPG